MPIFACEQSFAIRVLVAFNGFVQIHGFGLDIQDSHEMLRTMTNSNPGVSSRYSGIHWLLPQDHHLYLNTGLSKFRRRTWPYTVLYPPSYPFINVYFIKRWHRSQKLSLTFGA